MHVIKIMRKRLDISRFFSINMNQFVYLNYQDTVNTTKMYKIVRKCTLCMSIHIYICLSWNTNNGEVYIVYGHPYNCLSWNTNTGEVNILNGHR